MYFLEPFSMIVTLGLGGFMSVFLRHTARQSARLRV